VTPSMREWPFAFREWAHAYFGERWIDRTIDADWIRAYKLAFRAGFRAARRMMPETALELSEDELAGRLRAHMLYLYGLAEAPSHFNADGSDARRVRAIVRDLGIAVDLLREQR